MIDNNILSNLRILANIKIDQKLIIENLTISIDESYIPSVNRYINSNSRNDIILPISYTYTYIYAHYDIFFKDNYINLIDASFEGLLRLKNTYDNFEILDILYTSYYNLWNKLKDKKDISKQDNVTQTENKKFKNNSTQTVHINLRNNIYHNLLF